jgi:divalent metal cation (Fe/Co/Zn/Cd) transporter
MASILIGMILAITAMWLAYETKGLLIGESANKEVVQVIRRLVGDHATVEHVNEILTMHMGPEDILVNLSVDFVEGATAEELEASATQLDKRIKQSLPRVKRVFIEAEARRTPNPEAKP